MYWSMLEQTTELLFYLFFIHSVFHTIEKLRWQIALGFLEHLHQETILQHDSTAL